MTQETVKSRSSNFARTCNRFSQFLKEKRCAGEFGFGSVTSPNIEMGGINNKNNIIMDFEEKKSLNLFPLTSSSLYNFNFEDFNNNNDDDDDNNNNNNNVNNNNNNMVFSRNSAKPIDEDKIRTTRGSMTIFYDGKVVVYDGLQDDMARDIISLATESVANTTRHDTFQPDTSVTTLLSDFPIARGASLHRFMEKRKHRISANVPYNVNNLSSRKQIYKPEEEHQLELKLW